ncbi:Colicin V production protein [Symmachiella dynata]|uniref:Colicin V production protein n=1 Tax=Symmachiella dynata TaxID=2527995 RepID=A0A517ZPD5_9PLAN|nr:CvpA family protein [Symmachiella dynata]QDU44337.1 Colicin V production protein [Symmachiella dynata]
MEIFDGIVLVVLIAAIVQGRFKGMAWQLAPIASLVLGYVVAFPMAGSLAPWFGDSAPMNYLLALLVLYLAVALGVYLLARSLKEYIVKFKLEEYDKHLGALFGGVKGLMFCLAIIFFSVAISAQAREYITKTHSGYAAAYIMDALHPAMPEELHEVLEEHIHALDRDDMDLKHRHEDEHDPTSMHEQHEQIATKPDDELLLPPLPAGLPPLPPQPSQEDRYNNHQTGDNGEPRQRHSETGDEVSRTSPSRQKKVVDGVLKVLDLLTDN